MGKKSKRSKKRSGNGTARTLSNRQGQYLLSDDIITDDLLDAVLSRGVPEKHLNSKRALRKYFLRLLHCDWARQKPIFFAQLVEGLTKGAPEIDKVINEDERPFTPLCAVCQWQLVATWGWTAQDELVDMVLRAGADVHQCLDDGRDALLIAVEVGTLQTVDLILQVDNSIIQRRHTDGRSCLSTALLRPSPPIISRLLEYLPADETFATAYNDGQPGPSSTAPDRIMRLVTGDGSESPSSWDILGMPKGSDVSEALMILRQKGARFSCSSNIPLMLLVSPSRSEVLGNALLTMWNEVAKSLVGAIIPHTLIHQNSATEAQHEDRVRSIVIDEEMPNCGICQSKARKKVTLYCGHSFCRKCIIDYCKIDNGETCPICHRPLCLDLCSPPSHNLGSKKKKHNVDAGNGPQFLTYEQVKAECQFQGIHSDSLSPEELRRKFIKESKENNVDSWENNELANNPDGPTDGYFAIDITISGIPLLARMSHQSVFTIVSKNVVENLGLKRNDGRILNKKLIDCVTLEKIAATAFTWLEPFCVNIGDIEVTICTAIEVSPDLLGDASTMFGIQLGRDFLYAGVWCPKLSHGEMIWEGTENKEMLRFYSHEGTSTYVPILRFYPFLKTEYTDDDNTHFTFGVSTEEDVKFEQCYWCCRRFPTGWMKVCSACKHSGQIVTYCDEECQRLAFKIHKKTHHEYNRYQQEDKSLPSIGDID